MNIILRITQIVKPFALCLYLFLVSSTVYAQNRCGTMDVLSNQIKVDPVFKSRLENQELQLQKVIKERVASGTKLRTTGPVTIPVVFHIVLREPSQVTDQQVMAQLDTINKDYAGANGQDQRIIAAFRNVYGQSGIQFCLAQRTPDNKPTTGIVRYSTTQASFPFREGAATDNLKHSSTGGADAWDTDRYLNIWICDITGDVLGYATFPNIGQKSEQGVVVDLSSIPGGSATNYNYGKTLTHEIGHFFNLLHIWGDDFGSCSGTDEIDDTPNQGNSTNSIRTGILTDNCSPTAPGIMYQNFMDYTPDAALLIFTRLQVVRMEAALNTFRLSLTTSDACQPVSLKKNDARLKAITQPNQRLCEPQFTPQVVLENRGLVTLTTLTIHSQIGNGPKLSYNWTGSLATNQQTTVTLPAMETVEGNYALTLTSSNPNGTADEDLTNDQLSMDFMYYKPVEAPVSESFEGAFLPKGWDIVNPDNGPTWEKVTGAAKTGNVSVRIGNFDYALVGQKDYLRSPTINIANTDSAFVSFQVAAATSSSSGSQTAVWDTLQVLVSTDCGLTYTSVYKKWGSTLVTRSGSVRTAFTPTNNEWRREEINIGEFINRGEVLVAFQNTTGNSNNVFLDDINIRTVTVNPNLKAAGFLVTPNPTDGAISVQFYPHPAELKSILIYNIAGKLVAERTFNKGAVPGNIYDFDLRYCSAGMYVVKAVFEKEELTKRFVKVK